MAVCDICKGEMLEVESCHHRIYKIEGKQYKALPYVQNPWEHLPKELIEELELDKETNCHDCGCKVGEIHHLGCDMERCPSCKGQFISCGCDIDEEVLIVHLNKGDFLVVPNFEEEIKK